MHMIILDQPATQTNGIIIFGVTNPRIRRKYGEGEYVSGHTGQLSPYKILPVVEIPRLAVLTAI